MTHIFLKIWNLYLEGIDITYFDPTQNKSAMNNLTNVEVDFNRKSVSIPIQQYNPLCNKNLMDKESDVRLRNEPQWF